jgi:hypothetical protein
MPLDAARPHASPREPYEEMSSEERRGDVTPAAYWPSNRYLELALQFWCTTCAKLDPKHSIPP